MRLRLSPIAGRLALAVCSGAVAIMAPTSGAQGFDALPASAHWAVSAMPKRILEAIPMESAHRELMDRSLNEMSTHTGKLIGMAIDPMKIHEIAVFGNDFDTEEPSGLIVRSDHSGRQFLDRFRAKLIEADEMNESDLPPPEKRDDGLELFRVKDDLVAGEIRRGLTIMAKTDAILQSISEAKGLPPSLDRDPYRSRLKAPDLLAAVYISDMAAVTRESPGTLGLKNADELFLSIHGTPEQWSVYVSLTCEDSEATSLVHQSLLGLKAMATLFLNSATARAAEQGTPQDPGKLLLGSMLRQSQIRVESNTLIIEVPVEQTVLLQFRDSLFSKLQNNLQSNE